MTRALLLAAALWGCGPKGAGPATAAAAEPAPRPAPPPSARPAPPKDAEAAAAFVEGDAAAAAPAEGPIEGPTEAQAALLRALSARDGAPTCASLDAQTDDPVTDYRWVVEHVTMPPTAGMRAAECLILGHAPAAADLLRRWVTEPQLKGFGWVTLRHLDGIDPALATELATLALTAGPDPVEAARRIRKLKRPELRALADDPALKPR